MGTPNGYAVPDVRYLAPLDGLDPIAAAPLACGGLTAFRAVHHALPVLGVGGRPKRVAVIGAGGLGQFAIRYLRLLSDATVVAVDIDAAKRTNALGIGAAEAIGPTDELGQVDAVIDFAATDATLALAAGAVRRRGIVVVVGLGGGRLSFGFAAVPHEARFLTSVWGSRSNSTSCSPSPVASRRSCSRSNACPSPTPSSPTTASGLARCGADSVLVAAA